MQTATQRTSWVPATLCAVLAVAASVPLVVAAAPRRTATLKRDVRDARWLRGHIVVDAAPAQVLERVAEVGRWHDLFSDVRSVRVVRRGANHWHVRLDTRTMDCGEHDYHVTVIPGRRVDLLIDAPGIDARGSLSAQPSASSGQSDVRFDLFIDTAGFLGWFIPESTLRERQERMVKNDLEDLAKSFAHRTGS